MEQLVKQPEVTVRGLSVEEVIQAWPFLRERIGSAAEEYSHGEFIVDDLLVGAVRLELQFWIVSIDREAPSSFIVTRILNYSRKRVCKVVLVVGKDFDVWGATALSVIGQWAKSLHCVEGEMTGRRGWLRKLAPLDWHETSVTMTRTL